MQMQARPLRSARAQTPRHCQARTEAAANARVAEASGPAGTQHCQEASRTTP